MINNTDWTGETLKTRLVNHFSNNEIENEDIRLALNFFYAVLGRARRSLRRSDNLKVSGAISVGSSGVDLKSQLSDIGGFLEDFKVFLSNLNKESRIYEKSPESTEKGYYILDTTLFLTGSSSGTIYVKYQKKSPRIADSEELEDHDILIDQDLEQTLFRFAMENFLDGKFQYSLAQINEDKYYQSIRSYLNIGTRTRATNPY